MACVVSSCKIDFWFKIQRVAVAGHFGCLMKSTEYKDIRRVKQKCIATTFICDTSIIDCIKEMDVTSVTSPIGLWTAARKPIVSNLGGAILKISGACWEK